MNRNSARFQSLRQIMADAKGFRSCSPSADPDEQTAVTTSYHYIVTQIKALAAPLLSRASAARLNRVHVDMHDIFSVYTARAEIDALLPEIEDALDQTEREPTLAERIPQPVCVVVGDVLGGFYFNHRELETLFLEHGAPAAVPPGNCVEKVTRWLTVVSRDATVDACTILGGVLKHFMDDATQLAARPGVDVDKGRQRVRATLARHGMSYISGGRILGAAVGPPTKSLETILRARDLQAISVEFDRALQNVETDPAAAITAACSVLEALFKVYIEDEGLEPPGELTVKPLWKVVHKHIGFDPARVEDEDLKKILSGLASIVDGLGALRTHAGSAHGRGRKAYRVAPRHARLAIHAAHSLATFVLETWDQRRHLG